MYFTIESDREVSVNGIGILKPGEPHRLTDDEMKMFEIYHNAKLIGANFAPYVKVTAVLEDGGGE